MAKYCCFRFDADTHVCVQRGIPVLTSIAASLGVQFTFFINMGRAFHPWVTASKAASRLVRQPTRRGSFSAAAKLGLLDSLIAAVKNTRAGRSAPDILRAAAVGNEIGLHGGRNHASWERYAHRWSKERLHAELLTGLHWMHECGIDRPQSFASPAWNSPRTLPSLLASLGFHLLADTHDRTVADPRLLGEGLVSMPTNITASSGSAGYLESMHARGWTHRQIIHEFVSQLRTKQRLGVVYDHPFYAALHARKLLVDLVQAAKDHGFVVCSMREATASLST